MIAWPTSLPQTPFYEFTARPVSGLYSESSEQFPRRNRTYPDYEATFQFNQLTLTQMQALRTFYDVTLNQQAPFAAPWLAGVGFTHHFCQFTSPPSVARRGRMWDVNLNVRVIATVPVDDGDIIYGST